MPKWLPYCGEAPLPAEWLSRWNLAPELMLLVAGLLAAIYSQRHRLQVGPAIGAVGLIGCLYISPFCALGSALFAVRIVHDVVLVSVFAPLVVAALRLERLAIHGSLVGWTVIHVLTFWLWHAPPFYEAAMSSDATFWAMQVSIVATAALWWAKVFRAPAPAATTALLATLVAMGSLGALLTFAHRALYAPHWLTTQDWGLSPLEDQQIAGIVMWAPGSLVYLLAALTIVYRSLGTRAATI